MIYSYLVSCPEKGIDHKILCNNCVGSYDVQVTERPSSGPCEDCGATIVDCDTCNGSGIITNCPDCDGDDPECNTCDGESYEEECSDCNGSGTEFIPD